MPLTNSLLPRLLGGALEHNSDDYAQNEDFIVRLHDALLPVVDNSEVNLVIAEDVFEAYGANVVGDAREMLLQSGMNERGKKA